MTARKKQKKISANVVPFELPAKPDDEQEQFSEVPPPPPSKAEVLEMLVAMDDFEYERCRVAKAIEWGIRVEHLDRMYKHAQRERAYRDKREHYVDPDPNDPLIARILQTEGVLDLFVQSWDKVMAGEHLNAKLLYLIATSRLFDRPMHVAIKGPSSGGKSEIRKQVLEFFPPEDVIAFTMLSEKALLNYEGEFSHKIISMAEATDAKSMEVQDLMLRQLMSDGMLDHITSIYTQGHWVATRIVKKGPVSFMVTTTKATLHPENETRMISLEIDDGEAQTRRVLAKQAKTLGRNVRPDGEVYLHWQGFQRLLRDKFFSNVDVPFADALAALIPPRAVRLRRDYPQIIACIKAHALIHVGLRDNNESGELIADLERDYAPVANLIGHIVSEGAGTSVSSEDLETIEAVKIITADINMPKDDGATALEVGKKLGLDKATAGRRLSRLWNKGFVVNMEEKKFRPGKWRLTDQEVEALPLLPSVEEIRAYQEAVRRKGSETGATAQPQEIS